MAVYLTIYCLANIYIVILKNI